MIRGGVVLIALLVCTTARADEVARLQVTVTPTELLAGSGETAAVTVTLPGGAPVAAEVRASVGEIVGGRLDPGERRTPAVILIAATAQLPDGRRARGATTLVLIGRGNLPTVTEPGAQVMVRVRDKRFGPLVADAAGEALVPVHVHPDETEAEVEAVTPTGRRTTTTIALPPIVYPRAVAWLPERVVTGIPAVITVATLAGSATPRAEVGAGADVREGPLTAVDDGWWETSVVARAPGELTVGVYLGDDLVETRALVAAAPPPPPRPRDHKLGMRLGVMTSFTAQTSWLLAADWRWRWLAVGVTGSQGDADRPLGMAETSVRQVAFDLGARLRVLAWRRLAVDLGAGVGAAWVHTQHGDTLSPFVYLGSGAAWGIGPGEVVLDLRYADLRVDDFRLQVDGNTMGLGVSTGYRVGF